MTGNIFYSDIIELLISAIGNTQVSNQDKLALLDDLEELRVGNPNYQVLLTLISLETDPTVKNRLIEQTYIFETELTQAEENLFDYCDEGYINNNPGIKDGVFSSYVGSYYSASGDKS